MKLTNKQLKQIIKEELEAVLETDYKPASTAEFMEMINDLKGTKPKTRKHIRRIQSILQNPEVSDNEKKLSVSVLKAIKSIARKAFIRDEKASKLAKWNSMDLNELSNYVYKNFEALRDKIPNNPYDQASAQLEILKLVAELEKFILRQG